MDKAKLNNPPDMQQQAKTRQQQMIISFRILKSEIHAVEEIVSFYEMPQSADKQQMTISTLIWTEDWPLSGAAM